MNADARRAVVVLALCASTLAALAAQDPALDYQSRGNRSEGLRKIAVAGYDVELLSARAEPSDAGEGAPAKWNDAVRLRFYLPDSDRVFITVRQLKARGTYYWLDKVRSEFKTKAVNEYDWPTEPVLRKLTDIGLEDLGATVRLGQEEPSTSERVLPAILFGGSTESKIDTYRFQLKTNARANVTATIYTEEKQLYRRQGNWEEANSPFTVRWQAASSPEGWYRLVISGYFRTGTPIDKEVRFYHRPTLSR